MHIKPVTSQTHEWQFVTSCSVCEHCCQYSIIFVNWIFGHWPWFQSLGCWWLPQVGNAFRSNPLILSTLLRCSCDHFVEQSNVFSFVLHNLHWADWPCFSHQKCCLHQPLTLWALVIPAIPHLHHSHLHYDINQWSHKQTELRTISYRYIPLSECFWSFSSSIYNFKKAQATDIFSTER